MSRMLMPFFLLAAVNALVDGAGVIQAAEIRDMAFKWGGVRS